MKKCPLRKRRSKALHQVNGSVANYSADGFLFKRTLLIPLQKVIGNYSADNVAEYQDYQQASDSEPFVFASARNFNCKEEHSANLDEPTV